MWRASIFSPWWDSAAELCVRSSLSSSFSSWIRHGQAQNPEMARAAPSSPSSPGAKPGLWLLTQAGQVHVLACQVSVMSRAVAGSSLWLAGSWCAECVFSLFPDNLRLSVHFPPSLPLPPPLHPGPAISHYGNEGLPGILF